METLTLTSLINWKKIEEDYLTKFYIDMGCCPMDTDEAESALTARDEFMDDIEFVRRFMLEGDDWANRDDWRRLARIIATRALNKI